MHGFQTKDEGEREPPKRKRPRSSYKQDLDTLCSTPVFLPNGDKVECGHQKRKHIGSGFTLCGVCPCPCTKFRPPEKQVTT